MNSMIILGIALIIVSFKVLAPTEASAAVGTTYLDDEIAHQNAGAAYKMKDYRHLVFKFHTATLKPVGKTPKPSGFIKKYSLTPGGSYYYGLGNTTSGFMLHPSGWAVSSAAVSNQCDLPEVSSAAKGEDQSTVSQLALRKCPGAFAVAGDEFEPGRGPSIHQKLQKELEQALLVLFQRERAEALSMDFSQHNSDPELERVRQKLLPDLASLQVKMHSLFAGAVKNVYEICALGRAGTKSRSDFVSLVKLVPFGEPCSVQWRHPVAEKVSFLAPHPSKMGQNIAEMTVFALGFGASRYRWKGLLALTNSGFAPAGATGVADFHRFRVNSSFGKVTSDTKEYGVQSYVESTDRKGLAAPVDISPGMDGGPVVSGGKHPTLLAVIGNVQEYTQLNIEWSHQIKSYKVKNLERGHFWAVPLSHVLDSFFDSKCNVIKILSTNQFETCLLVGPEYL